LLADEVKVSRSLGRKLGRSAKQGFANLQPVSEEDRTSFQPLTNSSSIVTDVVLL
jgi:hypothetical protein